MIASLFQRLMIATLLPACALVLVLAGYFSLAGLHSMEAQLFQHGQDIVRYMAPSSEYGLLSGNRQSLQSMVQITMEQRDVRGAAIVSIDSQILALSGRLSLDDLSLQKPPSAPKMIGQGEGWVTFAAPVYRTSSEDDGLFQTPPKPSLNRQTEVIGQIVLELDTGKLLEQQKRLVLQSFTILIPTLLFFAFFTARLAKTIIQPILRLAEAAKAIAEGQTDTRVPETSKDEIGYLERGFNHMIDQVSEVHQTLHQRIDEATAQLAYQARHDPLTGLINRREFETRLEGVLDITQAGGTASAVLFIDLDRFKKVNDVAGHVAGDELLRRISKQLQNRIRETDTLARLGGDEFAVLLNDCPLEQAHILANSLCQLVAAYHFPWEDKVFTIGASIGLVEMNRHYQSVVDVLGAGDVACYAAKAAGKNRVEIYQSENIFNHHPREIMGREILENAISQQLISYQAVPLHTITRHSESNAPLTPFSRLLELQGFLQESSDTPPILLSIMMEIAERCEIAPLFDQLLLDQAAHQIETSPEDFTMLVRISSASVRNRDFTDHLGKLLLRLGSQASQLCVLVSEETAIHFPHEVAKLSDLMREFDGNIGLDDFGGWMGSFKHLQRIQPNLVRITTTLTRDISNQRGSIALVRAIQEFAKEHLFQTIATGVSDEADRLCLESLGVNFLQIRETLKV
jgi:diguanylate cyclase (GGDEF)-like protein